MSPELSTPRRDRRQIGSQNMTFEKALMPGGRTHLRLSRPV